MAQQVILVVEDHEFVRGLLALTLSTTYQVFTAENGEIAMDMIGKVQPDLLILDIGLGDGVMDGYELLELLRGAWCGRNVPILMMSGHGEEARIACMRAGASGYITKPYSPTHLLDRVDAFLCRNPGGC